MRLNAGGEGTSEGGSESSSIAGSISARMNRVNSKRTTLTSSATKKKSNIVEPQKVPRVKSTPANSAFTPTTPRTKARTVTPRNIITRTPSVSKDRGRSREKSVPRESTGGSTTPSSSRSSMSFRSATSSVPPKTRSRPTPVSLPSVLTTEINKDLAQRGRGTSTSRLRGGSSSVSRTPGSTPSEEARKAPSSTRTVYTGRLEIKNVHSDRMTMSLDKNALELYATLPRRPRNRFSTVKSHEKDETPGRSRSNSRETSTNRLMTKKLVNTKDKNLPAYPKAKTLEKTRIYHEISVQTGLTGKDIENVLAGIPTTIPNPETVERLHQEIQTEGSWQDFKELKADLTRAVEETAVQKKDNEKLKAEIEELKKRLQEEQADHAFVRQELDRNAQRVLMMLGTPQSEYPGK